MASSVGFLLNGTDETAALLVLMAKWQSSGGGCLAIDTGKTLTTANQVVVPTFLVGSNVRQANMRITGAAGGGASSWNLTYSKGPKISTTGFGVLELDHLTLEDTVDGTQPFIYTTNTRLLIHDNTLNGKYTGFQDIIILGGPSYGSGFGGYGTVIWDNVFGHVNACVRMQATVNGVVFRDNHISYGKGVAPIVSTGVSASPNHGAMISGNLVETDGYQYMFQGSYTTHFTFIGNNLYDPTSGIFLASYRFETTSTQNYVYTGEQPSSIHIMSEGTPGSNFVLAPVESDNQPTNFLTGIKVAGQAAFAGGVIAPSITVNGGTPITGSSSKNSQVVTCPPGGSGTQYCDASGAWVSPNTSATSQSSILTGTTGNIGGSALAAGVCTSGAVSVNGATTSMVVVATPATYPGDGISWSGYVSATGTVAVRVCASVAVKSKASTYNVRVIQ